MFELRTKEERRWGLTIGNTDVYFTTKQKALVAETIAYKIDPEVRMFEECRLWDISQMIPKQLSYTKFDRTYLISGLFNSVLLQERFPTTIDNEKK